MTAVFDSPEYECDVILKGGITSGIVYPPAIAELAQYHRFRGIAGASAGAIGASAAAAEVGRQSETGRFGLLDSLPAELSATDDRGRTKLLRLFQPQDETRPIFDIVWQARSTVGMTRVRGILKGLFREARVGCSGCWLRSPSCSELRESSLASGPVARHRWG
ncbi:MAG: patatin-like phospholipase family protein [Candidatus Microthrix sp.]|nr:patatin-like phospholipase family protein [Candidatus Microthrix sp.]